MSQFVRIFMLSLLAVSLFGCNKSKSDNYATATDLIHERAALAHELDKMGPPDSTWDERKVEVYEARVDRLAAVEKLMRALNDQGNVVISGEYNDDYICKAHKDVFRLRGQTDRLSEHDEHCDRHSRY